jgi:hypothetical protein
MLVWTRFRDFVTRLVWTVSEFIVTVKHTRTQSVYWPVTDQCVYDI